MPKTKDVFGIFYQLSLIKTAHEFEHQFYR